MANEVMVIDSTKALTESKRGNYNLTSPLTGNTCELIRERDFMVIPGTKKPSLLKEGCEKIVNAYGLIQRYSIESKIEEAGDNPMFFYLVKCELVKVINPIEGKEIVLSTGYGSANSREKRNGFNSAYDAANNSIKMAVKRSLTSATIAIAGLSDLFSMDMENDAFIKTADDLKSNLGDDAPITPKQTKRIFAIAKQAGYSVEEAKTKFQAEGFTSTKDIKQKDYDKVCALFEKPKEEDKNETN